MKNTKLIHSATVDGFRVSLFRTHSAFQVIVRNRKGSVQYYRFSKYQKAYEFFCHACDTLSYEKKKSSNNDKPSDPKDV